MAFDPQIFEAELGLGEPRPETSTPRPPRMEGHINLDVLDAELPLEPEPPPQAATELVRPPTGFEKLRAGATGVIQGATIGGRDTAFGGLVDVPTQAEGTEAWQRAGEFIGSIAPYHQAAKAAGKLLGGTAGVLRGAGVEAISAVGVEAIRPGTVEEKLERAATGAVAGAALGGLVGWFSAVKNVAPDLVADDAGMVALFNSVRKHAAELQIQDPAAKQAATALYAREELRKHTGAIDEDALKELASVLSEEVIQRPTMTPEFLVNVGKAVKEEQDAVAARLVKGKTPAAPAAEKPEVAAAVESAEGGVVYSPRQVTDIAEAMEAAARGEVPIAQGLIRNVDGRFATVELPDGNWMQVPLPEKVLKQAGPRKLAGRSILVDEDGGLTIGPAPAKLTPPVVPEEAAVAAGVPTGALPDLPPPPTMSAAAGVDENDVRLLMDHFVNVQGPIPEGFSDETIAEAGRRIQAQGLLPDSRPRAAVPDPGETRPLFETPPELSPELLPAVDPLEGTFTRPEQVMPPDIDDLNTTARQLGLLPESGPIPAPATLPEPPPALVAPSKKPEELPPPLDLTPPSPDLIAPKAKKAAKRLPGKRKTKDLKAASDGMTNADEVTPPAAAISDEEALLAQPSRDVFATPQSLVTVVDDGLPPPSIIDEGNALEAMDMEELLGGAAPVAPVPQLPPARQIDGAFDYAALPDIKPNVLRMFTVRTPDEMAHKTLTQKGLVFTRSQAVADEYARLKPDADLYALDIVMPEGGDYQGVLDNFRMSNRRDLDRIQAEHGLFVDPESEFFVAGGAINKFGPMAKVSRANKADASAELPPRGEVFDEAAAVKMEEKRTRRRKAKVLPENAAETWMNVFLSINGRKSDDLVARQGVLEQPFVLDLTDKADKAFLKESVDSGVLKKVGKDKYKLNKDLFDAEGNLIKDANIPPKPPSTGHCDC